MYYFELFETPVSLVVNKTAILKKYYELSKEYHPDNFSLEDAVFQEKALVISSEINKAKKVLDNASKRLEYILTEKNIIKADEKYALSPTFLGEMMDINEQIMELEFEKDETKLEIIKSDIKQKESELFEAVKPYFEMNPLNILENDYFILKEYYYKKKYMNRILERLNEMM